MNSILPATRSAETLALLLGQASPDAPVQILPVAGRVVLGFPSPAEDYSDDPLDLSELLIPNPPATLLYRAEGSSMAQAGILDGDILIADSSVKPEDGDVVIASWSGNVPVCKVLRLKADHIELHSRNPQFAEIVLSPETEAEIVTVVGVARQLRQGVSDSGR